jgi:AcrR family transcriptional regulator
MARAGLTTARLVEAATDLVDREGPGALTLAKLADRFGVRPPSLYNHIDSLEALVREVTLTALEDLVEECRDAVMGRSGGEALRVISFAYRRWALAHPGTYPLTQVARPDDEHWTDLSRRLLDPLVTVLEGMHMTGEDAIHAVRALRSALHGFVVLEIHHGFGLAVSTDESFEKMVDTFVAGIDTT